MYVGTIRVSVKYIVVSYVLCGLPSGSVDKVNDSHTIVPSNSFTVGFELEMQSFVAHLIIATNGFFDFPFVPLAEGVVDSKSEAST